MAAAIGIDGATALRCMCRVLEDVEAQTIAAHVLLCLMEVNPDARRGLRDLFSGQRAWLFFEAMAWLAGDFEKAVRAAESGVCDG